MVNEHLCVGRQLICLLISVGINALIMTSFGIPGDIMGCSVGKIYVQSVVESQSMLVPINH